ncbi:hypothetical protein CcaCcLH18_00021 [Colletotrichum camelliae]|nr:hypothetical protein CcaCcLH18_00021 [Colletotrichum camelliae]
MTHGLLNSTAGRYGLNGSFVIYANLKKVTDYEGYASSSEAKSGQSARNWRLPHPSTSKSDVPVATFQFGGCETPDELIAIHAVEKGALVNLGHGRRVNSAS